MDPKAYQGNKPYIFISYAHKDKEIVYPFIFELQKNFNVWFDDGIAISSDYVNFIMNKILHCSVFIFMVSNNSLDSKFCKKEIHFAEKKNIPFINIIIEDMKLPDIFDFEYGDLQNLSLYRYPKNDVAIGELIRKSDHNLQAIFKRCVKEEKISLEEEKIIKTKEIEEPLLIESSPATKPEYNKLNDKVAEDRMKSINELFNHYRINACCSGYVIGPSITRFNIEYKGNASYKDIERFVDKVSILLEGVPTRFVPIIPGESFSGIEIPNVNTTFVDFKEVFDSLPEAKKHPLAVAFGKDVTGKILYADFDNFPHLLVTGTTGSGKSNYIHSIISTLIARNSPDYLRLVLIDPKKVEMFKYRQLPHLLCPIITEPIKAKAILDKLVEEMNERYDMLANVANVANIKEYNEWAKEKGKDILPNIIVIIDEYADLVDACKEISQSVVSIAQKARAAGIHLLISTQRPHVNIITGLVKANFPTRISFLAGSLMDSITVIGEGGAEKLNGRGDMLVQSSLLSRVGAIRLQACFIKLKEITQFVGYAEDHYNVKHIEKFSNAIAIKDSDYQDIINIEEQKYQEIKRWVLTQDYVSISKIQRECGVGFNRAGRYFMRLQKEGIVSTEMDTTTHACRVIKK